MLSSVVIPFPERKMAGEPGLVTIRVFMSESEANIAKGALDAFGVGCMISHDDAGGQDPFLRMVQGIRLLVRQEDAARAEEVLSAPPI